MKNNNFSKGYHDHLSYYIENDISPVHQNISNLRNHFDRRSFLYDSLGVNRLMINNSKIFEFGPGSGHNSLYISHIKSKKYYLFEPNPTGYNEIKELYKKYKNINPPKIFQKKLEDYSETIYGKANIVIAEAWIGSFSTELKLIKKLSKMVDKKGILITTFQPPIGMLPNMLRRILSYKITNIQDSFETKTKKLSIFFKRELKNISKMTRPVEDWVQDTLLNPAALTSVLSIEQILDQVGPNFQIYNTYPKYFKLFEWYKNFIGKNRNLNNTYISQIYKNYYSFLDMNITYEKESNIKKTKILNSLINKLFYLMFNLEKNKLHISHLKKVEKLLLKISSTSENLTLKSMIEDTISCLNEKNISKKYYSNNNKLLGIFGKELCYISLQNIK